MKVFIINLEKSLDRKQRMQKNIESWKANNAHLDNKVAFEFFKAKTPDDIKKSGFINRYNRFLAWLWKARDVRETELACFASHYSLWEKCVELNEPIIVMEDDLDFTKNFAEGIQKIPQYSFDYVRLCWSSFRNMILVNQDFAFAHALTLGTGGYYITPNGANKLMQKTQSIYLAIDYYISHSYLHGVEEMLYIHPMLVLNELDTHSTIGKPEHQTKTKEDKARYKKFVLLRELHRIYRQFRTLCFALSRFPKIAKMGKNKRQQSN